MLNAQTTNLLAQGVLGLLAVSLLVFVAWDRRRLGYTRMQYVLYVIWRGYVHFVWRATIDRPARLVPGRGAILIANHRSSVDQFFVQLATSRVVRWMVAREFFNIPLGGWILRDVMGCIPVSRAGIDTAATKAAIRLAQQGEVIGMFPEGRINETDQLLLPARPGVALIALRARVPVVPMFIHGAPYAGTVASSFFMTARVRVRVGDPIDLSPYYGQEGDREVLRQLTLRFLKEMARLAGHEEFQPRLAGKRWMPRPDETDSSSQSPSE